MWFLLLPCSYLSAVASFWQLLGETAFPELESFFPLHLGVDFLLKILCWGRSTTLSGSTHAGVRSTGFQGDVTGIIEVKWEPGLETPPWDQDFSFQPFPTQSNPCVFWRHHLCFVLWSPSRISNSKAPVKLFSIQEDSRNAKYGKNFGEIISPFLFATRLSLLEVGRVGTSQDFPWYPCTVRWIQALTWSFLHSEICYKALQLSQAEGNKCVSRGG